MMRLPPRRGTGSGVVVKSMPSTMPVRVVSGNNAMMTTKPVPNVSVQSQPKYQ